MGDEGKPTYEELEAAYRRACKAVAVSESCVAFDFGWIECPGDGCGSDECVEAHMAYFLEEETK